LTEQFNWLLWLNLILSLIPIIVGVLVSRVLINIRVHREEFLTMTKDVAVLKVVVEDIKDRVVRIEEGG